VNAVDDVAFVVGLEVVDLDIGISLTQCFEEVFESLCAVDAGFAMAQEVEVGAVDDEDVHMVEGSKGLKGSKSSKGLRGTQLCICPFYSLFTPLLLLFYSLIFVFNQKNAYFCAANIGYFFEMDKKQAAKYYSHLKFERNLTDNSVEAYLHDIEKLQKFADNLGKPLEALEQSDIETFLWGLRDVGITPTSQNRILAGIRSYYRFLRLEGELEADPTDCIDSPKLPEHVPTVLTLDEVNRVIAATDPTTCDGQRNRAILETLYSCGLRVSELTELRIGHIYEKEGFIQVFGKGRKERIVPIAESALREIHNYYLFRNELDVKRGFEDYVFLNRFGRKLSRIMVFNIVKRYCQEANVQKEVSPHTFRHTFATHLLEGGANLRAIQMMLGHEQISTTEIYTKVDRQMLREEILTYHPRNKMR